MKNDNSSYFKKIFGAVVSSVLFISIFLFVAFTVIYFQVTETDKMPTFLFIVFLAFLLFPVISIIINLIFRIKEIKGGEEDEASKY